jgi:UDP-glucose:(heptosyl)LPS alpha-1,3-glucosyltransferase
MLDSLASHLEHANYDIVHAMLPVQRCDVYQPHPGIAADNFAFGHQKKGHVMAQGASWIVNRVNARQSLLASVERDLLTGPNPPCIVCLSDAQKRIVLDHYPSVGPQLVKLFNAVDLARFDPAGAEDSRRALRQKLQIADDQVLALLISQNWELKGVRQAIEAVARVQDRRLVLVLVGKDDPKPYEAQAKSLGVADQLRFPGPTNDTPSYYRAADFFVLPTRSDVCSLVVLEALAMGLPVISTAANGACEIMELGRHGFVVDNTDDIPALTAAMLQMLDPAIRTTMSAACLELRPHLSYQNHLITLVQIYRGRAVQSRNVGADRHTTASRDSIDV